MLSSSQKLHEKASVPTALLNSWAGQFWADGVPVDGRLLSARKRRHSRVDILPISDERRIKEFWRKGANSSLVSSSSRLMTLTTSNRGGLPKS